MGNIAKLLSSIEKSKTDFGLWLAAFLSLISFRLLVESWLFGFENRNAPFLFFEWTHNVLFFLLSFVLFLPLARFFLRISLRAASNVLLFGFLVILTPPIIDFLLSGGRGFWSFYIFDGLPGLFVRFLTFFGDRPDMGITYGVRVEVAVVTIFFGWYVFYKFRSVLRALAAAISSYALLFFLGTFPSWAAIPFVGISDGRWLLRPADIAGVFLSSFSLFSRHFVDPPSVLNAKMSLVYAAILPFVVGVWLFCERKSLFLALFRNSRFPQVIYHGGLFCIGMGFSMIFSRSRVTFDFFSILSAVLLLGSVILAWLASVVVNDRFDASIDRVTNKIRPIPSGAVEDRLYSEVGAAFFFASILLSAIVFPKGALLLFLYQSIAWSYSAPPFRLKRFPVVATSVSALASLLVLFIGYMSISRDQTLEGLPASLLWLFFFSYAIALPLKDFKDIEGDRRDGVWTLPVLLGVQRSKLLIGTGIFLSFLTSVSVFRSQALFLPALLFGGASFWAIIAMKEKTGRITYRSVFGWMLAFVFCYGIFVVRGIFQ